MSMLSKSASALPRRTHRKRVRLSTDTTTTLPEYHLTSTTEYQHPSDTLFDKDQVPLDKPPDYPDSAEEADEDTDSERQRDTFFVHPSLRRKQRHYPHKRKFSAAPLSAPATSSVDPYIDSLLERSVHALEMSNTLLLQNSMSTQTSLSRMVACDSPVDTSWEARAKSLGLPARRMTAPWMEDLEEITRRVDSLFGKAEVGSAVVGSSSSSSKTARLRLAHRTREDLISPPPRALTQYIETDSSVMAVYPSAEWNTSTACLHSSPALPIVTDKPLSSSSTPAYAKLASFVVRRPSKSANATPCSSFTGSSTIKRRNSSVMLGSSTISLSPRLRSGTSINHESPLCHQRRPMTPPVEESPSSSSSDGCVAKRTITSLRKILDEQPQTVPLPRKSHVFMPVTPPPRAVLGTSSATASISRMLTKKLHHASTRPASPPRSAMKGSRPTTPLSSSSSLLGPPLPVSSVIKDTPLMLSQRITARVCSASSSGQSTPKRISFAELPEAHVSSRPDKFRDKGRWKGKGKGKGKGKSKSLVVEATTTTTTRMMMKGGGDGDGDGREGEHVGGWFTAWFGLDSPPPVGMTGLSYAKRRDEMEDRISRNWAGRFAGGYDYLDEWGV